MVSGEAVQLIEAQNHGIAYWAINGGFLVYYEARNGNYRDLWYLLKDQSSPMPFLQTQFQEALPTLSPDGEHVAYQSNKPGTYEIYVKPFRVGRGEWTMATSDLITTYPRTASGSWSCRMRLSRPPIELSFRTGSKSSKKGINIMVLPSIHIFPKMFSRVLHNTSYLPPASRTDAQHQFSKE